MYRRELGRSANLQIQLIAKGIDAIMTTEYDLCLSPYNLSTIHTVCGLTDTKDFEEHNSFILVERDLSIAKILSFIIIKTNYTGD